jgi:hypothetical protein
LPFASSYRLITTWFSTVIFLQGTYTPLVHAHAGRTQGAAAGQFLRCAPKLPQSAALCVKNNGNYYRHYSAYISNPHSNSAALYGVL